MQTCRHACQSAAAWGECKNTRGVGQQSSDSELQQRVAYLGAPKPVGEDGDAVHCAAGLQRGKRANQQTDRVGEVKCRFLCHCHLLEANEDWRLPYHVTCQPPPPPAFSEGSGGQDGSQQ